MALPDWPLPTQTGIFHLHPIPLLCGLLCLLTARAMRSKATKMSELIKRLKEIADRHDERMKTDFVYRHAFAVMQAATRPADQSRHYDRDGYCDNPSRGY